MENVNRFEVACKCGHVWFMWVRLLSPVKVEPSFKSSRVRARCSACVHAMLISNPAYDPQNHIPPSHLLFSIALNLMKRDENTPD